MNDFEYTQRQNPDPVVELARVQLMREVWESLPEDQRQEVAKYLFKEGAAYLRQDDFVRNEMASQIKAVITAEVQAQMFALQTMIKDRIANAIETYGSVNWNIREDARVLSSAYETIRNQILEAMRKSLDGVFK